MIAAFWILNLQASNIQCGSKPIMKFGCRATCEGTTWKVDCEKKEEKKGCGFRPAPRSGCILECNDEKWEYNCKSKVRCGSKPIVKSDCHVGSCTEDGWEIICDRNPEIYCGQNPGSREKCTLRGCINYMWKFDCEKTEETN
jgi:hypothetical protein